MLNVRYPYSAHEQKDYENERYRFIELMEGSVARVYTDSYGIPTVGIGHAFSENITKNKVDKLLRKAFSNPSFTLTDTQWTLLSETISLGYAARSAQGAATDAAVNAKNTTDPVKKAEYQAESTKQYNKYIEKRDAAWAKILPAANSELHGTYISSRDNMSISFSSTAMKYIFDEDILEFEGGIIPMNLPNSKERISILSLRFNGIAMPTTEGYINGSSSASQRVAIWYEIRYRSNKNKNGKVHRRRIDESDEFGLFTSADGLTPESDNEAKQVVRYLYSKRNTIEKDYINKLKYTTNSSVPRYDMTYLDSVIEPTVTHLTSKYVDKINIDGLDTQISTGITIDGDIRIGGGIGTEVEDHEFFGNFSEIHPCA